MPHGTPDWGLVGPKETIYGLDDLGEHAVRLGSPHLFDRRGDILLAADFAEGFGDVTPHNSGALSAATLHAGYARLGAFCAKLTAGSSVSWNAGLLKIIPYPVFSRLGMEISFGCGMNTDYIELHGTLRDAAGTWHPTVRWDPSADTIICQTGAVAWHTMTTTQQAYLTPECCNTLKMVFDLALGRYVRVIANEQWYDLGAQPIYRSALGGRPHFEADALHVGDNLVNAVAYADCFIVTQNEP